MGTMGQDVRYALRQLMHNPGYTGTVVFTLALAIGANTAIFSIVNALLLRNLPYAKPERMGTIFLRVQGPQASDEPHSVDGAQWEMLRDRVPSLISAVSSGGKAGVNLEAGGQAQYVHQGRISAHYLDVLAVRPMLGRNFTETEDRPQWTSRRHSQLCILAHGIWRQPRHGGACYPAERRTVHDNRGAAAGRAHPA